MNEKGFISFKRNLDTKSSLGVGVWRDVKWVDIEIVSDGLRRELKEVKSNIIEDPSIYASIFEEAKASHKKWEKTLSGVGRYSIKTILNFYDKNGSLLFSKYLDPESFVFKDTKNEI